jgi:hypothetical protein
MARACASACTLRTPVSDEDNDDDGDDDDDAGDDDDDDYNDGVHVDDSK